MCMIEIMLLEEKNEPKKRTKIEEWNKRVKQSLSLGVCECLCDN